MLTSYAVLGWKVMNIYKKGHQMPFLKTACDVLDFVAALMMRIRKEHPGQSGDGSVNFGVMFRSALARIRVVVELGT